MNAKAVLMSLFLRFHYLEIVFLKFCVADFKPHLLKSCVLVVQTSREGPMGVSLFSLDCLFLIEHEWFGWETSVVLLLILGF